MKYRKNAYRILLLLAVLTGAALLTMRPERDAPEGGIVVAGGNTTERQILAEITAQMIRRHYLERFLEFAGFDLTVDNIRPELVRKYRLWLNRYQTDRGGTLS